MPYGGIDFQMLISVIEREAIKGGSLTADYALERIRHYAPVRKLFRGTTYQNKTFGKQVFRVARIRRVFSDDSGERRGHANSIVPLFRRPIPAADGGGTAYVSGDFRRRSLTRPGHLARIKSGAQASTVGEYGPEAFGRVRQSEFGISQSTAFEQTGFVKRGGKIKQISPASLKPTSAEELPKPFQNQVTARGRYEIKSGRADFKSGGVNRVGGRLRGELHIKGPVTEGNFIYWYIVSDTVDPNTGYHYPAAQEFGSSHNRPHPFMRPGLYDSRIRLVRNVIAELERGLRTR